MAYCGYYPEPSGKMALLGLLKSPPFGREPLETRQHLEANDMVGGRPKAKLRCLTPTFFFFSKQGTATGLSWSSPFDGGLELGKARQVGS